MRLSHIEHTDIVIWGLSMINCGHPILRLDKICQGKPFPQNSDSGKFYRGKFQFEIVNLRYQINTICRQSMLDF
jgi:hypothetical protein